MLIESKTIFKACGFKLLKNIIILKVFFICLGTDNLIRTFVYKYVYVTKRKLKHGGEAV